MAQLTVQPCLRLLHPEDSLPGPIYRIRYRLKNGSEHVSDAWGGDREFADRLCKSLRQCEDVVWAEVVQ